MSFLGGNMAIYEEPVGNPAPLPPEAGPTDDDYNAVAEEMVPQTDEPPVGTYSSPRLKAFLKALNAKIEAGGAEVIDAPTEEIENGPLPVEMFKAYLACRAISEDFIAANPDEEVTELPDTMSLVDDSSLAMATVALQKIASNKKFARWAKEAQPEAAPEAALPPLPVESPAVPEAAVSELAALA
jgi:hypothetical protein